MATYLLLDGHSLSYRAWFALQEAGMRTSSGQETQAVYGFVSMVTRLLDDFAPDGMAVAFDRHEPTFRDEIVDDYKAGRPPMPDPLRSQIELIRGFVTALGVPAVDALGFEADDVLGTLATRFAAEGHEVIIVTGDRDTYQLVADPYVKVLYNRRGVTDYVLYDEAGIIERTGVAPPQYPLLAAFRGDPSDNLPGVPGVGEKTAAKLVIQYGSVDAIFANLDKMTPKFRESLGASEDQVRRNLLLTPIVCDVPVELTPDDLTLGREDRNELERVLDFLEMRTLKERLFQLLNKRAGVVATTEAPTTPARPVVVLDEPEAFAKWAADLEGTDSTIALEPAWTGLAGRSAITGIAFAPAEAESVAYLDGSIIGEPVVVAALRSLLGGTRRRIVGHRVKELMRSLLQNDIDITSLDLDTAVVAYLVDPSTGQESLEGLAGRRYLSVPGAAPATSGQLGFDLAGDATDIASETAGRAEVVGALGEAFRAELEAVEGTSLWEEIERPLERVLARMEVAGVGVDVAQLESINAELTAEVARLEAEIHSIAGEAFNLNSPPQLRVVLYDKLGLRPQRKTKTGYSTDAQTLERLREEHPIIEVILAYREVEKLRSTYGQGLLAEVAPDGRIHASFGQTVARTGRLSSDAPNLHNIPVRTEAGKRFREAFVPAKGFRFLVADYNQIELRVIAHLAGDPGLVVAFDEHRDIHTATAAAVFGVDPANVTGQMRAKAKMVSYGLAYGMEAYGLAQRLGIGVDEAQEILASYFVAFPSVRAYMEGTVAEARVRGYTETERGRRRYLPELRSDNFRVRQSAERQAMNAGIQGLAADIFKIALVQLDGAVEAAGIASHVVLQVHDEVLVEVAEGEAEHAEALVREAMEHAYPLRVPLEVNLAWGDSWAGAKPV